MQHLRIIARPEIDDGQAHHCGHTHHGCQHILRCLAAGDSLAHILRNYPHLTEEDICAAQAYAADYLAEEGVLAAE